VRSDAELGMAVHFLRADLHFERAAVVGDHRGVQRAVEVSFRVRDVVVEFAMDRLPQRMHHAQGRVAVAHLIDDDAQRAHVIHLIEIEMLLAHLVPDAVDVLGPAINGCVRQSGLGELCLEARDRRRDERLAFEALFIQLAGDLFVGFRFGEAKRQILDLPFDLPDAEPIGERSVDLEAFPRDVGALRRCVIGEPAQRLGARRQAHQHDADIRRQRQQHLAQDFRLPSDVLAADEMQRAQIFQAVEAIDQLRERSAPARGELLVRIGDEIGRREQQRRQPRIEIEIESGEDQCRAQAMIECRLARAEFRIAIDLAGVCDRCAQFRRPLLRQTFSQA
jgi:hypothetical protein